MNDEQSKIDAATRRVVGISTLRLLQRMVAEEQRQRLFDARWAKAVSIATGVAALLLVIWLGPYFAR